MTRQKSDERVVPDDVRKAVGSGEPLGTRGGKALAVNQEAAQIGLPFATADNRAEKSAGAAGESAMDLSMVSEHRVPKANDSEEAAQPATMMEEVVARLESAFEKVASNKGAAGPDGQDIETVRRHLPEVLSQLRTDLLSGTYEPGAIRRVWIPKSGGGQRGLGIPNVVDRVVQEALRAVLEPLWEPTFHPSSHGFRPERSCQTAIAEARQYVIDGYEYVVDIDLEKFFDRVNHQRLMARVATRVSDRRVLVLLGTMLKAKVVMPDGVKVSTDEGVPQGGPLSPLLSNIVLDELDIELTERGLRFVRYADDCNIYVRSMRAGQRVMTSITQFIDKRLRLRVNASKSAVARPEERHFLGYRLRKDPQTGIVDICLSVRSMERVRESVRIRTPRNWGRSLEECISDLNVFLRGWFGFFGICTGERRTMSGLDAHIRRRVRAMLVKQWKRAPTIARNLMRGGVAPAKAWAAVKDSRRNTWALSHHSAVERATSRRWFAAKGLDSLLEKWLARHTPSSDTPPIIDALVRQLTLFPGRWRP
jgi:RNA-directed DNA polymerase